MKYKIEISGGFTGFIQKFEGQLDLDRKEEEALKQSLIESINLPENKELRDGFNYAFQLEIDQITYHNTYDDSNLPKILRNLIDTIKK